MVVLPCTKCPHQIQGVDFIPIFPVIQWLMKRAIETREEFGDYIVPILCLSTVNITLLLMRLSLNVARIKQLELSLHTRCVHVAVLYIILFVGLYVIINVCFYY